MLPSLQSPQPHLYLARDDTQNIHTVCTSFSSMKTRIFNLTTTVADAHQTPRRRNPRSMPDADSVQFPLLETGLPRVTLRLAKISNVI